MIYSTYKARSKFGIFAQRNNKFIFEHYFLNESGIHVKQKLKQSRKLFVQRKWWTGNNAAKLFLCRLYFVCNKRPSLHSNLLELLLFFVFVHDVLVNRFHVVFVSPFHVVSLFMLFL